MINIKCKTCNKFDVLDREHDECWRCTYKRNPNDPALHLENDAEDWWDDEGEDDNDALRADRHAFYDDDQDESS